MRLLLLLCVHRKSFRVNPRPRPGSGSFQRASVSLAIGARGGIKKKKPNREREKVCLAHQRDCALTTAQRLWRRGRAGALTVMTSRNQRRSARLLKGKHTYARASLSQVAAGESPVTIKAAVRENYSPELELKSHSVLLSLMRWI